MKKDNKLKNENLGPTGNVGPQEHCAKDGSFGVQIEGNYSKASNVANSAAALNASAISTTFDGTPSSYYCYTPVLTKTTTVTKLVYRVNKKGKEVLKKKVVETITDTTYPSPYTITSTTSGTLMTTSQAGVGHQVTTTV